MTQFAGFLASSQGKTQHSARSFKVWWRMRSVMRGILVKQALVASGQFAMRKVDGWQSLAEKPSDQIIDLAARCGNLSMLEIVRLTTTGDDTRGERHV
jgi:hypothetical protein